MICHPSRPEALERHRHRRGRPGGRPRSRPSVDGCNERPTP